MLNIRIEEINGKNVKDVNKTDGVFIIDSKLNLQVEDNEISYTVEDIPYCEKRYENWEADYSTYIDNDDKTIYLAYIDKKVVGQIILKKNWNNYAFVEDIRVDMHHRKEGIGKMLICFARDWASVKNLQGIMLETQNNNVRACKFYESCGFKIGGFDKALYKGINKDNDEIAMYWYYML